MLVELEAYIKLLAGLLSVVDPIGAIPLFISLTEHRSSDERQRIACVCAMSVGAALLIAHIEWEFLAEIFRHRYSLVSNCGRYCRSVNGDFHGQSCA